MLKDKKSLLTQDNLLTVLIASGCFFMIIGLGLISQAWAVNSTAITETLDELRPNSAITGAYHVFWIIFFMLSMAVCMGLMLRMRESKETSIFSIMALLFAIIVTMLLVSPFNFDIQTETTVINVIANETQVTEANVSKVLEQVIIIPYDSDMRIVLSFLFTGITLFNGLYTIFIITGFRFGK